MIEIINPNTIIGECLQTAFKLKDYRYLINTVQKEDFKATGEFRNKFNAYYRVRQRSEEWYQRYYELMESQKRNPLTFDQILAKLSFEGRVEASFSSKLLATIDPQKPIWDQYVLRNLRLPQKWKSDDSRSRIERIPDDIEAAKRIYEKIENWYEAFLASTEGYESIMQFDELLPDYSDISNVKKVDLMLWGKRL